MSISNILINFIGLSTVLFNISGFSTVIIFHRFFFFKLSFGYFSFRLFFGYIKFHEIIALIKIIIVKFFYFEKFSWFWSIINLFGIFFNPFFIEFIIQFDYYFIENIQFIVSSPVPHKLIFNIFFQIFFKYIY